MQLKHKPLDPVSIVYAQYRFRNAAGCDGRKWVTTVPPLKCTSVHPSLQPDQASALSLFISSLLPEVLKVTWWKSRWLQYRNPKFLCVTDEALGICTCTHSRFHFSSLPNMISSHTKLTVISHFHTVLSSRNMMTTTAPPWACTHSIQLHTHSPTIMQQRKEEHRLLDLSSYPGFTTSHLSDLGKLFKFSGY